MCICKICICIIWYNMYTYVHMYIIYICIGTYVLYKYPLITRELSRFQYQGSCAEIWWPGNVRDTDGWTCENLKVSNWYGHARNFCDALGNDNVHTQIRSSFIYLPPIRRKGTGRRCPEDDCVVPSRWFLGKQASKCSSTFRVYRFRCFFRCTSQWNWL
jgi:hypothetical protein